MAFIPDAPVVRKKSSFVPDNGSYRNDMSNEEYLMGTAKNILPSAGRTAMAMVTGTAGMANPNIDENTLAQTARAAYGGLQKLDPTKGKFLSKAIADTTPIKYVTMADKARGMSTDYQPQAEAIGKFYGDRYGGVENIKKSVYEDPTGVALDASVVLGGGSGISKGIASATGSTRAARVATALGTASKYTNPLTYAGKATGLVTKPVQKMSKFLASEAESMPTRGMGNPMALDKAKGVSPLPMDKLFEKYNTWERTPEAFQQGLNTAKKQGMELAKTAEETGSKVDLLKVLDELNANIKKLSSKSQTSDKAVAELEELLRRRRMLVQAVGEQSYTPLKVSPAKVTKIKQNFQADMPDSAFGKPMSEMNKASGTKKAYRSLIGGIEEAVPGTQTLGREESALIKLKEIARKQESRLGARQNVNFSRLGGAGLGGLIGGIPGAIQGYALEQVANSPQFLRLASKGARKVSNIFSGVGKAPI